MDMLIPGNVLIQTTQVPNNTSSKYTLTKYTSGRHMHDAYFLEYKSLWSQTNARNARNARNAYNARNARNARNAAHGNDGMAVEAQFLE